MDRRGCQKRGSRRRGRQSAITSSPALDGSVCFNRKILCETVHCESIGYGKTSWLCSATLQHGTWKTCEVGGSGSSKWVIDVAAYWRIIRANDAASNVSKSKSNYMFNPSVRHHVYKIFSVSPGNCHDVKGLSSFQSHTLCRTDHRPDPALHHGAKGSSDSITHR